MRMQFLRKSGVVLAASFLPVLLFGFGLTLSIYNVFGTPDHLKRALVSSGFYDNLVDNLVQQANTETSTNKDRIPLDQPRVRQIIQGAAPPARLQQLVEGVLDNTYAWARAETPQLSFSLDLSDVKANLSEGLAAYASERSASLPVCAGAPSAEYNPLEATCIPPGVSPAQAAEQIRAQINENVLKDPIISSDSIETEDGKPVAEQLRPASDIFEGMKKGMWLSGITSLLLAVAIVLLSKPWQNGLKRLGVIFISVGAITSVTAILLVVIANKAAENLAGQGGLQAGVSKVLGVLAGDFRAWLLGFGITLLVLGIGALVARRFIWPTKPDHHPADTHQTASSQPDKPENPFTTKTV